MRQLSAQSSQSSAVKHSATLAGLVHSGNMTSSTLVAHHALPFFDPKVVHWVNSRPLYMKGKVHGWLWMFLQTPLSPPNRPPISSNMSWAMIGWVMLATMRINRTIFIIE
jgi:hypothetical protein